MILIVKHVYSHFRNMQNNEFMYMFYFLQERGQGRRLRAQRTVSLFMNTCDDDSETFFL